MATLVFLIKTSVSILCLKRERGQGKRGGRWGRAGRERERGGGGKRREAIRQRKYEKLSEIF